MVQMKIELEKTITEISQQNHALQESLVMNLHIHMYKTQ